MVINDKFPTDPAKVLELLLLESNKIPNLSMAFRCSILNVAGGYPEQHSSGEDWLWFMRLALKGIRFHAVAVPLVSMTRGREHVHLMKKHRSSITQQRKIIKDICAEIHRDQPKPLRSQYSRAMSRQMIRELPGFGSYRGITRAVAAVMYSPFRHETYLSLYSVYKSVFIRRSRIMSQNVEASTKIKRSVH